MDAPTHRYLITAYSEWEILDVDAQCLNEENAIDKARRHGSLKYIGRNSPTVIFAHISAVEEDCVRDVGTWEYRLRGAAEPGLFWHAGTWPTRPMPEDRLAIRRHAEELAEGG